MNPLFIMALIATLKQEVVLLEQELKQEQVSSTVQMQTYIPPVDPIVIQQPVSVPIVQTPAIQTPVVSVPTVIPSPVLGVVSTSSLIQVGVQCNGPDGHDMQVHGNFSNFTCPAGTTYQPLYQ